MAGKLEGRRIFITGISRGIGRAMARLFLDEGAHLMGVARDRDRLTLAAEELAARAAAPDRFEAFVLDVTAPGAAQLAFERVGAHWGGLDVLVNNAAVMTEGPRTFEEEPAGTLEQTLAADLLAPYNLSQALVPLLRRGREPRIVHVTSGAGTRAALDEPGISSYRLAKWALNGLTRLQSQHLRGEIAVNGLDPGWVKTDLGGPKAPGVPEDSAKGALSLLLEPFETTGRLWKDGKEIEY